MRGLGGLEYGCTMFQPDTPRLLLVEDHPLMRDALVDTLTSAGYETMTANTATAAVDLAPTVEFDGALVNLNLPDRPGLWVLREYRSRGVQAPLAVFSASCSQQKVLDAFAAGASGFISKHITAPELLTCVGELLQGLEVYDEHVSKQLLGSLRRPHRLKGLSPREVEVLSKLASGVSTGQIAADLCISPHTVKDALRQCFKKLEVHDRAAAVAVGFRLGYLK